MRFRKLSIAAGLLVAVAAYAAVQDAVPLKWTPKVGTAIKYKVKAESKGLKSPMGDGDMEMTFSLNRTIKEVKEGKVSVEEVQDDLAITFNGQDVLGGQSMKITSNSIVDLSGKVIERKSDAPEGMDDPRMEAAFVFEYPNKELKAGESWTVTNKGDSAKKTVSNTTTYTFAGTENVDGALLTKITTVFKETEGELPMTGTGTLWLSGVDGEMVKSTYALKNVELGPLGPNNLNISTSRA